MTNFEVYSSLDGGVVFGGEAVEWEAKARRVPPRQAALIIARENEDPLTTERLLVRATPERVVADEKAHCNAGYHITDEEGFLV